MEFVMYRVTGYWRDKKIVQYIYDRYDAIDYKDIVDANYPIKVTFEKVIDMREFIYDAWNGIMDSKKNPLRHIPDTNTRHMVLQVLAWMWCIAFSSYFSSMWIFGITAIAHIIILAAIAVTVATFEMAKSNPRFLMNKLYHTPSRARAIYIKGKRYELDPRDVGGEHE